MVTFLHHDVPRTFKTWDQRNARINRLGQQFKQPDVHTLTLDDDNERAAWDRMERKRALHEGIYNGASGLEDTGLSPVLREHILRDRRKKAA